VPKNIFPTDSSDHAPKPNIKGIQQNSHQALFGLAARFLHKNRLLKQFFGPVT
jgi:hypothetical protein